MPIANEQLRALQDQAGATFVPFGPTVDEQAGTDAVHASSDATTRAVELVDTFGNYEAEYAAIRKGVGILHEPQRGVLRITGDDRQDFLHRMLTQDIAGMAGGDSRRAFQLNVKGRIIADVIVHHGEADTWLEADAIDLPDLAALYDARLFGEDVTIQDITTDRVALALHGPAARDLLHAVGATGVDAMIDRPGTHHVLSIGEHKVTASRRDACGVPGVRLWLPAHAAVDIYTALTDGVGGLVPNVDAAEGPGPKRPIVGRALGWLAFNTARIEAGCPLYHVDIGPDSLPQETAVLDQAVSFTKGCYLGQEVVARMHNLGHPKQILVALRGHDDRLPVAGSPVVDPDSDTTIGAVTSSTLSPMLANTAIAFAMIKWGKHRVATKVQVPAEGQRVEMTVGPLTFVPSP